MPSRQKNKQYVKVSVRMTDKMDEVITSKLIDRSSYFLPDHTGMHEQNTPKPRKAMSANYSNKTNF